MIKLFFGITFVGLILRVVFIDQYPRGFTPDEASFGYDAYSILNTGRDQWGEKFPLSLRSFGDFKLPFYTYLATPFIAALGLNEFAVRLPNALIGTLSIIATYLLVGRLWPDKRLQLLASLLVAISPWHISLSRGAFEANLTTFLLPMGIWSFLKGYENKKWLFASAVFFGLNLFSYHSARFVTPLIVLWLVAQGTFTVRKSLNYYSGLLVFLVFLFVAFLGNIQGSSTRSSDIAIFNPTGGWGAVADRRYEAVLQGFPDILERLFVNKVTYTFDHFLENYFSYFSPQFLFSQGAGEWTYGMIPGRGVLYLFELTFVLFAIYSLLKNKLGLGEKILIFWLLISILPTALSKGPGYAANRAAIWIPAVQILSAYGGVNLLRFLNTKLKISHNKLNVTLVILMLGSCLVFLEDYIYHAPNQLARGMLYGRQEAIEYASSLEENYNEIIISRGLSEPHIYVAFYKAWDPTDYQKQAKDWLRYEKEGRSFVDQLGSYSLGKYHFTSIEYSEQSQSGNLLIGNPRDFPEKVVPVKTVFYPDGKPAILIVDPAKINYASNR